MPRSMRGRDHSRLPGPLAKRLTPEYVLRFPLGDFRPGKARYESISNNESDVYLCTYVDAYIYIYMRVCVCA